MKRIVLAYSGGLVSSAAIPWLLRQDSTEVVTVTLDFGQERELATVRERALALGAVRAHVIDAREEFVRDFLLPSLQAGAMQEGYALPDALIARRLADVARMESAAGVSHGAARGARLDVAIRAAAAALEPSIAVIVPAEEWGMTPGELSAFARENGVPVSPSAFRADVSLWGRRLTALPGARASEDPFVLTRSPEECPDDPAYLEIEFAAGTPVRANGVEMSMIELIESLETIAGAHGVGRSVGGEILAEAPAATVLDRAHGALELHVIGDDLARMKAQLSQLYSDALLGGGWFSDIREAVAAFTGVLQRRVTGTVKLKLLKGGCYVVGCESTNPAGPRPAPVRPGVVA